MMWGKRKENGIWWVGPRWSGESYGSKFIWRAGRIYVALGRLRARLVYAP